MPYPVGYVNLRLQSKEASLLDFYLQFHKALYGDAKSWARRFFTYVSAHIPGVINPHAQAVQRWNKFFVISCVAVLFIDPLFLLLLYVPKVWLSCSIVKFTWLENICCLMVKFITFLLYFFSSLIPKWLPK